MVLFLIFCILVLSPCLPVHGQDVFITEFLAINGTDFVDEDGESSDWIEIQNMGENSVDLEGWYLTDDAADLEKWSFPEATLGTGDFLVVFASGKDRQEAGAELHTNFKLSSGGEYLALVKPDGATVQHEFSPAYPAQRRDVSYGIAQAVDWYRYVDGNTSTRILIPSNDAFDADWMLPAFNDGPWPAGTTRVGYETEVGDSPPPGEEVNIAPLGIATQSSTGWGGEASRAIDGNTDGNYGSNSTTHTETGDPAPSWQVRLQETSAIDRIVLWNRTNCCPMRLSNFRVSVLDDEGEAVFSQDFFTDGVGHPTPGVGFEIPLPAGIEGRIVKVALLGPNSEGEHYLTLAEVQVFEGSRGYRYLIDTDVTDAMLDENPSAYIRAAFQADDLEELDTMTLWVKYDDGFVAYLNGHPVARRNAPAGTPGWNAAATAENPDHDAVLFEAINLSAHLDRLEPGENVLAIHALNVAADDVDFLMVFELEAATIGYAATHYCLEPTPGAVNDTESVPGFVADTRFSANRGFYDDPFLVEITTETPDAEIHYTLNGSAPTPESGIRYTGSILIDETTVLRAMAFKPGLAPTNVDTQTYIFLDQIIDSNVMTSSITNHPTYGPQMRAALLDLPSISIVTEQPINGSSEVDLSLEWIPADGTPGFQEDAGIRYFGGAFTNFAKKNFRIYFRGEYGARKLRFPIFEGHQRGGIYPVDVFDQLELRSGSHDMVARGFYMSNRFTDDTMLDMGNVNPHGRFVHLYRDGVYWGQYHLRERWNADMLAQYLGGEKEDYEAINGNWNVGGWADPGVPYDGDGTAWTRIKSLRDDYEAVKPYLDVVNYIDFMILYMFGNCEQEYRCVGPTEPGSGFKFYLNDADGFTRDGGNKTGMNQPGRTHGDGPGSIFSMLLAEGHPDYKILLADRIHKHYFNDGAMTPEKTRARLLERCDQVERAFYAEAARWDEYRTPATWESAKNSYVSNILPGRTQTVINQFRSAGFMAGIEAPAFNRHGGEVQAGFALSMTAQAGTIYYTLDGTDPRLPGGALSPSAIEFSTAVGIPVVPAGSEANVHIPADGNLGLDWTERSFNDAGWLTGDTGAGYERSTTSSTSYADVIEMDLHDQLYQVNASFYMRIHFQVDDPDDYSMVNLAMKYDDGFVAYLNGTRIAARNEPDVLTWNASADGSHADTAALQFENIPIDNGPALLRAGGNVLAIHGMNSSSNSSDFLILPRLDAVEASEGDQTILDETTVVKARAFYDGEWSALNEARFHIPAPLESLKITEIMYNPPDIGLVDGDEYEFIELQNIGNETLDLSGVTLSDGVDFTFPQGASLRAGEFLVLAGNPVAFQEKYPDAPAPAGAYMRRLSNTGDSLALADGSGKGLLTVAYNDVGAWPEEADGNGYSLVPKDAASGDDPHLARYWIGSARIGGSPGEADTGTGPAGGWQKPGDLNQDGALDLSDAISLLLYLFGDDPVALPCEGGVEPGSANLLLLDVNGSNGLNLSDAIFILDYLFGDGAEPALGEDCIRMEGCPNRCL